MHFPKKSQIVGIQSLSSTNPKRQVMILDPASNTAPNSIIYNTTQDAASKLSKYTHMAGADKKTCLWASVSFNSANVVTLSLNLANTKTIAAMTADDGIGVTAGTLTWYLLTLRPELKPANDVYFIGRCEYVNLATNQPLNVHVNLKLTAADNKLWLLNDINLNNVYVYRLYVLTTYVLAA